MWLWWTSHGEASKCSFRSKDEAIADAQRHALGKASSEDEWYANHESSRLRLVLDVEYNLNGERIEQMKGLLRKLVAHAVGEGLLTGDSSAEVDQYSVNVFEHPKISEDELSNYFAAQIEGGHISPDEIAVKLARYGLMDPSEFAMEMQERIEMTE
jgi:hypothetical protein